MSSDLKAQLEKLYQLHRSELSSFVWQSEVTRWEELVFCLLNQVGEREPEVNRQAVAQLRDLGLLKISCLAAIDNLDAEPAVIMIYVLKRRGFDDNNARRAVRLISHVASVIQRDYGGKIQRYLRRHGEATRDELVMAFHDEALGEKQLRYAVGHWLQNALNMPISLLDKGVTEFCEQNHVKEADLWEAADELDLNLAIVDDILDAARRDRQRTSQGQTEEED